MPPSVVPSRPPTPSTQHVAFRPALWLLALSPWAGLLVCALLDLRDSRRKARP